MNKKKKAPRKSLAKSVDIVERFQAMCKLQMDLGNWVTMDYPTKHHLNRILDVQFMENEYADGVYGQALAKRARDLVPYVKSYIRFANGSEYELGNKQNRKSS